MYARKHGAGPRAIPGDGTVHHRKDVGVKFALHEKKIDHHFVNVLMRVVTDLLEQSADRILYGTGCYGMTVGCHRGHV